MKKILIFLMLLGLLLLTVKVVVLLVQNRFVFFPRAEFPATPRDFQMAYRDVRFKAADGIPLHGWFIPGKPGAPMVLYFHGNGGNIGYCLEFVKRMEPLGYHWFLFDYRQYGQSKGRISEEGFYRDALAAYNTCKRRYCPDSSRLVLWGFSIGTVAANHVARLEPAACLVLEAPFINAEAMAGENILLNVFHYFSSLELDNARPISRISLPKLIIHGTSDTIVPMAQGEALFQMALPPKEFYPVEGADHNNLFLMGGAQYLEKVRGFIQSHTRTTFMAGE